eukprot:TRINITY_DN65247_c0_g1_i1.p1 TRINITY_DN65247_c0_g1~~TRINITY_DN65247_c0_g1_i1.p1  ORF type:complete len:475 (+),score=70.98 TRINITY_DN65247_c0_g1_i1:49-1473(+)
MAALAGRVSSERDPFVDVRAVRRRRRLKLAAAAAMFAAVAGCRFRSGWRCFSSGVPRSAAAAWPDTRLWVERLATGENIVTRDRSVQSSLAVDAYSQRLSGTKEVRLGDQTFYAFAGPRLGAEQFVVWRRLEDVRAEAERWQREPRAPGQYAFELPDELPVRVTTSSEREQLTAAVWCWDNLEQRDPNRYPRLNAGSAVEWMYWDTFWLPSEPAPLAAPWPAFTDATGHMLQPTLGGEPGATDGQQADDPYLRERLRKDSDRVVSSTAVGTAQKDRAYAIVYEYNVWGSDVSRSGTGSDLWSPEARLAVSAIEAVIDRFQIRSMLDCACGDATWMVPFFVARHPEIDYTGVDIVPEVIEQNKVKHPGVRYLALDAAEAALPTGADMVFSKETLNHMSLDDAWKAVERFRATGARYLLTNVHEGSENSLGNEKGCYTTYIKYDFSLPPFNLRRIATIIEYQGAQTSYSLFELNAT